MPFGPAEYGQRISATSRLLPRARASSSTWASIEAAYPLPRWSGWQQTRTFARSVLSTVEASIHPVAATEPSTKPAQPMRNFRSSGSAIATRTSSSCQIVAYSPAGPAFDAAAYVA